MAPPAFCTWCGAATATHPDRPCRRQLDPPRFCPTCGRRLRVKVHPAGWEASCRDHGAVVASGAGPVGTAPSAP